MYGMNEIGLGRQHRQDLLREAENRRLVRELRAGRRAGAARLGDALLSRVSGGFAENLPAHDGRCA